MTNGANMAEMDVQSRDAASSGTRPDAERRQHPVLVAAAAGILAEGYEERKLAILKVMPQTEAALLKFAFQHSSDGMLLTDPKGIIRMVNDAFVDMFGFTREEIVGQRTGFLRSKSSTQEFYESMWRSLRENGEWKGEIVNRTKGGAEKVCFLTITPIFSEKSEHIGFLGVEIDLTERKRLESQVVQGEKLAAIGESVATLVHEIRNPLNGIAMNIYMLEQGAEDSHWSEEERESIHLISREAKRLEALVKNVLTYARHVELHYERVLLPKFLEELQELLVFQAEERKVNLDLYVEQENLTGRFDPDQMKQVMLNLVQNAIEAAEQSDQKLVRVSAVTRESATWRSISSTGKVLLFEVANSGPAISEDIRNRMFRPFFTTKTQGLGLGLATSAKIVRQHHGVVDVESSTQEPFSTIFTVALPA